MASNHGKFIDRSPYMCPAGKTFGDLNESVKNTLQEFPVDDKIDALQHDAKIWQKDQFVPPRNLPPALNAAYKGVDTEIKSLLQPGVKTRYQTLINDLRETIYHSYWNQPVGKVRDPVPGLPKGMDTDTVTFGMPYKRDMTAKELVNPPKTVYEVNYDSQIAHDWYIKTHNDYNAGEQVNRKYHAPPYVPDCRFGIRYNYDQRGIGMQRASQWFLDEPTTYCSKIRADFVKKWKPEFGKPLAPYKNRLCVPKGHVYGTPTKWDVYGAGDLIKDPNVKPSEFKREFFQWFQTLTKLRHSIRHLKYMDNFDIRDFLKELIYIDKEKTGLLHIDTLFRMCNCVRLKFNTEHIINLCKLYNIITNDNMIDYKTFHQIINPENPLVDIPKIADIPEENLYFVTTNQAAACDCYLIDNSGKKSAGVSSVRYDKPLPYKLDGQTNADVDQLGNDTNAKAVLNPNIYTNYGLTFRDFFAPRSAETIKTLFEKVGFTFPGNTFDELWKMGVEQDKTGLVCVDTFKNLLNICYPKPKLHVEENEC